MSHHISTAREVEAVIGIACLLSAAVFGWRGWMTNRPDSAKRFGARLWTWLGILGAWFLLPPPRQHWYQWALWFLVAIWCMNKVERWWRQRELMQRLERQVADWKGIKR